MIRQSQERFGVGVLHILPVGHVLEGPLQMSSKRNRGGISMPSPQVVLPLDLAAVPAAE